MKWWFSSLNLYFFNQAKCVEIFSADRFFYELTASQSPLFAIAKYSGLHFAWIVVFFSYFATKFSPPTAGNIDCNLSLFHLSKDDKKVADIFSITDLKHKY